MTLEEAKTIWLTLLGSEWQDYIDVLQHPMYFSVVRLAYDKLHDAELLEKNHDKVQVRIKCS